MGACYMGKDDRRKYARYSKQCIINFQIIESSSQANEQEEAVVLDYSKGGVRFSAPRYLKKNTKVFIKLKSDDWGDGITVICQEENADLLEIIGSVMWCMESQERPGEYEIGTQFGDDSEH